MLIGVLSFIHLHSLRAQFADSTHAAADSAYIATIEKMKGLPKVLHAEPLFIDLIRDLGARKGEKEWNFGTGITDNRYYDAYTALVEYEWAPVNRLGLEVELPFTFYYRTDGRHNGVAAPGNRLNSLKLAAQYTFLVHESSRVSMAAGYLHEFELPPFREYGKSDMLQGHLASPFVVAAKRWGHNWHTLLYCGPLFHFNGQTQYWQTSGQLHLNFHYMLPGTRNFVGLECNTYHSASDFDMTLRPQMRLSLSDNLLVGIVGGIPVRRENQRLSSFIRIIYEPGHRHRK